MTAATPLKLTWHFQNRGTSPRMKSLFEKGDLMPAANPPEVVVALSTHGALVQE